LANADFPLHYTLKQFDWLLANATDYDAIIIGAELAYLLFSEKV
jgi:hypothetical protein